MMLKFNVKNLFIAALGIIVLFLTSCGFFIDDSSPSADHKDPPKKVSQCELLGNTPRENNFEKFVSIERHFQRTLRYDCNNKLISDELETVKSPRAEVHIKRFEKHEIPENYEFTPKWNVYNRRTCGASGAYSASRDFLAMGLDVDMASALFTFRVDAGENLIDYDFTICEEYNENNECVSNLFEYKGTMILYVDYVEKTLEEDRIINGTCPEPESN